MLAKPTMNGRVEGDDISFRIYKYRSGTEDYELVKAIESRELIINNPKYKNLVFSEIEFQIQHESLYYEMQSMMNDGNLYLFERVINKIEVGGSVLRNPIFIFSGFDATEIQDKGKNSQDLKMKLVGLEELLFDRKVIQHNKFYENYESLPVDEEGRKVTPDDFGKISWEGPFNNFLKECIERNLKNPVEIVANKKPTRIDQDRKIKGLTFGNLDCGLTANLTMLRNEAVFRLILDDILPSLLKDDVYKRPIIYFELVFSGGPTIMNPRLSIEQSRQFELIKKTSLDTITSAKYKNDTTKNKNTIITTSSSEVAHDEAGNWIQGFFKNIKSGDFSTYEERNTSQSDDPIKINEIARQSEAELKTEFENACEIFFHDYEVMSDFFPGDVINIVGYSDLIDGYYYCPEIEEIVENGGTSFILKDLDKLDDTRKVVDEVSYNPLQDMVITTKGLRKAREGEN